MTKSFNKMAVTIQNQIQVLEEEARKKQEYVDNLAHEIRTPLTSIYGYAEYMQKASLTEEDLFESTQYIMDEAYHMNKIADSLLNLATLRFFTPIKAEIDLPRLYEEVSVTLSPLAQKYQVRLESDCQVKTILAQEDLLKSLLLNLAANAIKACSPHSGLVQLQAFEESGRIILQVRDNGSGIPAEALDKVTDPFYRVDKARSREQGGAGLGLALSQQIAQVHGAILTIESELGIGTQVRVIFRF
jgi:signal transduction histidine kinase